MGGDAIYYGKPYAPVFVAATRELHKVRAGNRPLVIGDGPETDIIGANRAGIDALFIVSGIHGGLVGDLSGVTKMLAESGAHARAVLPALTW
jgi:ribonucleotide monophosphatase NagD (HAD superfamily)